MLDGQARWFSHLYDDWRLPDFVNSLLQRGSALLERAGYSPEGDELENLLRLCRMLLTTRGEAFGMAAANEAILNYQQLVEDRRIEFFKTIVAELLVDQEAVRRAALAYADAPGREMLKKLNTAARPKLRTLIERLNEAPQATIMLVKMRAHLLEACARHPELHSVDEIFVDVFTSWFNKGFLELRRIDWNTPADILEKIIQYEAVHKLHGWEDLRSRILPSDRCLYAFFHPRLGNEPLIFVEVALTEDIPASIQSVLEIGRIPLASSRARVATFYSISNCQDGLRGIALGSFLIKQVVGDLNARFPNLKTFVTLSPVPGFARWLSRSISDGKISLPRDIPDWNALCSAAASPDRAVAISSFLQSCCAWYLGSARDKAGRPLDPVAKFHLGNGARLERVNSFADLSPKGLEQSLGLMVNYLYSIKDIEQNHENYANAGSVAVSRTVARLSDAGAAYLNQSPGSDADPEPLPDRTAENRRKGQRLLLNAR